MFLVVVLAASLTGSILVLVGLYAVILVAAAAASRVPFDFFVKRVWLGIPLFAGIVVIPAIFIVPGPRLFELTIGRSTIAPSAPGVYGADPLRHARRRERLAGGPAGADHAVGGFAQEPASAARPAGLRAHPVDGLPLHLPVPAPANGMFEARKSRVVARTSGGEQRRWISGTMGNLMNRSFKMSNDVYAAMLARGFTGEHPQLLRLPHAPGRLAGAGRCGPGRRCSAGCGKVLP